MPPFFLSALVAPVTPAALVLAQAEPAPSAIGQFLPLVLMIAVVYLLILRPMGKQDKDRRKRVEALKKGDEVILGGGILGRISNTDDNEVWVVEVADRVKLRVLKKDIADARVLPPAKSAGKGETKSEAKEAKTDSKSSEAKGREGAAKGDG